MVSRFMTTFDRYMIRTFFHVFVICFVSTYGLYIVIDGVTNFDAFEQTYSARGSLVIFAKMAEHYLFHSLLYFDLVGPIVTILSVIVAFASRLL